MSRVYIVDIEAVETRYTAQWQSHVPAIIAETGLEVQTISGPTDIPEATTPGAFLNFGGTNVYKASQVEQIGRLFCNGEVVDGDHFIFTDAWHPGIINLKYMSELLGVKITIHGLWHAGSYDPQDFLGRLIGDADWVRHSEKAMFHAIDHNYFATDFHIDMFLTNLLGADNLKHARERYVDSRKIIRTGWPMEYMPETLHNYKGIKKRDLILFPHRIAPEKQVDIFKDLAKHMPQYEFVVCQEQNLSKEEYHTLLGESKMVFSANLQETLGISCYEGAIVDSFPFVPDRLSYSEMYQDTFKYPSEWTIDWDHYVMNRDRLIEAIDHIIHNYEVNLPFVRNLAEHLNSEFFSADELIRNIQ